MQLRARCNHNCLAIKAAVCSRGLVDNICKRVELLATFPGRKKKKQQQKYWLFYVISGKIQHLNAEFDFPRIAPENLLAETAGRESFSNQDSP